jgi:hypothetical protein
VQSIECSMNSASPRRHMLHMSWHFAYSVLQYACLDVAEFTQNFGIIVEKIDKIFNILPTALISIDTMRISRWSRFIAFMMIIFYMFVPFMSPLLIPLKCSRNCGEADSLFSQYTLPRFLAVLQ